MKKQLITAGLAAGLVAGVGAGFALEVAGNAGASAPVVAPAAAGTDSGAATSEDHAAEHSARLAEILAPLVEDGTLTQTQADAVIAALEAAGPMGERGPGGRGLDTVATVLGLTADEVRAAIDGGQTLADLAAANGSSGQALIDALLAELQAHLDEEVASGEHTQEEADARLAEATTRITAFVNDTQNADMGPMGDGGRGGRGHREGHGPMGGGAGDPSGSTGAGGTIDGGPTDSAQG